MISSTSFVRFTAVVLVALLIDACASPPHKEMDQAQGALDAARAAGAERFAPSEYATARGALERATEAVADRDYRLALNHALEGREQAQNAARTAADTRARLRGNVERLMAEADLLLGQARTRLDGVSNSDAARRTRQADQQALDALDRQLQEAGAALQKEDYRAAERLLTDMKGQIGSLAATLGGASGLQSPQRRR